MTSQNNVDLRDLWETGKRVPTWKLKPGDLVVDPYNFFLVLDTDGTLLSCSTCRKIAAFGAVCVVSELTSEEIPEQF